MPIKIRKTIAQAETETLNWINNESQLQTTETLLNELLTTMKPKIFIKTLMEGVSGEIIEIWIILEL